MPRRARKTNGHDSERAAAAVRSFWSGTISFGLVSIPVDLYSATRPRQKSMKLVDRDGNPLGRRYECSKEGKRLANDDLVRGYETDSGKLIVITDEEFESMAPEESRDIELHSFVPFEQIPPIFYDRPYFLAPSGKSSKAYHLLSEAMQRSGRVAVGSFVMRGREYLVAIVSENGVLRAETLRYADEIRPPKSIGLPKRAKANSKSVNELRKEIKALRKDRLGVAELEDREADTLQALAREKERKGKDVIEQYGLEEEAPEGGAQVVDLMEVLRKSLSKRASVASAERALTDKSAARREAGSNGKRSGNGGRHARSRAARSEAKLKQASKSELEKLASDLHITGRSKMDKAALLNAILRAR
ncbi:MAG TPA: Ku protein [Steroidobacteraceae bacterium]